MARWRDESDARVATSLSRSASMSSYVLRLGRACECFLPTVTVNTCLGKKEPSLRSLIGEFGKYPVPSLRPSPALPGHSRALPPAAFHHLKSPASLPVAPPHLGSWQLHGVVQTCTVLWGSKALRGPPGAGCARSHPPGRAQGKGGMRDSHVSGSVGRVSPGVRARGRGAVLLTWHATMVFTCSSSSSLTHLNTS